MRHIALPLAVLLMMSGCKQAENSATTDPAQIVSLNQEAVKDPRRLLDLEGGVNFRDMGGYLTSDGKMVKWQTVYRSGSPAGLTEADQKKLSDLGIRTVCDFRTIEERTAEPNPYAAANSNVEYWTRDYTMSSETGDLSKVLMGPDASPEKSRATMTELYRTLPMDNADSYKAMFQFLADGKTPLAFNCTAGKDRAGTGAALLLTLLGVPRETVVEDYALTDDVVDFKAQMEKASKDKSAYASLSKVPWEILQPLMASDPAYLEAAFGALEEQYGTVDAFIEQRLGVTPEMREKIRANLLEQPA
ncbi:MAG: tyrosine-protein phosphatase [Sphingomonadaceae bacterium]